MLGRNDELLSQIDVACLLDGRLLVYGWVLNFSNAVAKAVIHVGDNRFDLVRDCYLVARPDVSNAFPDRLAKGEEHHGFYALFDLPVAEFDAGTVRLDLMLKNGAANSSDWPITSDPLLVAKIFEEQRITFDALAQRLPQTEGRRLVEFRRRSVNGPASDTATGFIDPSRSASAASGGLSGRELGPGLVAAKTLVQDVSMPIQLMVGCCCLLNRELLVVCGSLLDSQKIVTGLELWLGETKFDLLGEHGLLCKTSISRSQSPSRVEPVQFALTAAIAPEAARLTEATICLQTEDGQEMFRQVVFAGREEARTHLSLFLASADPNLSLQIVDRIRTGLSASGAASALDDWLKREYGSAVDRLPIDFEGADYFIHIDLVIPLGKTAGYFIVGWMHSDQPMPPQVLCRSYSGAIVLSDRWDRYKRPDVDSYLSPRPITGAEHGFACIAPIADDGSAVHLLMSTAEGRQQRIRVELPARPLSALESVRAILGIVNTERPNLVEFLDRTIGPAVQSAWALRDKTRTGSFVVRFGEAPVEPAISIIVPLFGRYDLVDYQMALFANDPDIGKAELIYVVDDPAIAEEVRNLGPDLYGLYGLPFVIAFPGKNLGFSGANNFGAELARGKTLLLLNSDVFPKENGWLAKLRSIYRSKRNIGILGAKLLFEDESVQHAGIEFRRHAPWGGLWINHHLLKGSSGNGLTGVQEAAAVTAACMMIDAELYREFGGLGEDYIIGDFEDSDLCLKVRETGRRNFVALDVGLYHLERQSQSRIEPLVGRINLTLYNCWLHSSRWDKVISGMRE